ncbi:methyltransferase domain-containing protein [Rhodobacteraceae bacterium NNCM2]|nr:methyltransferase domain-containing protein [Coraliihabitans acroporae]
MSDDKSLEGAYALKTPDDSVRLYADWAKTYDAGFAESHGYVMPQRVAGLFESLRDGRDPVLDIGAGTGLVAEHLGGTVDAVDISAEMLEVAGAKGLYRRRLVADLTQTLPIPDAAYAGFISTGTFTHGHVGPVCLPELMRIARPGALFCLAINAQAFDEAGFGSAFAELVADRRISPIQFQRVRIYAEGAGHEHGDDEVLVAVFHRE